MRILELANQGRAQVWLGDVPDAAYEAAKTVKWSAQAETTVRGKLTLAAIEIFLPLGPHWMYGLLGGQFKPELKDRLDVDVLVSSSTERFFVSELTRKSDDVRTGLPVEYVEATIDGISLARGELDKVAPGTLVINRAAHGQIGSSEVVFKHLAVALVKLFNIEGETPTDDKLMSLFPTMFS